MKINDLIKLVNVPSCKGVLVNGEHFCTLGIGDVAIFIRKDDDVIGVIDDVTVQRSFSFLGPNEFYVDTPQGPFQIMPLFSRKIS